MTHDNESPTPASEHSWVNTCSSGIATFGSEHSLASSTLTVLKSFEDLKNPATSPSSKSTITFPSTTCSSSSNCCSHLSSEDPRNSESQPPHEDCKHSDIVSCPDDTLYAEENHYSGIETEVLDIPQDESNLVDALAVDDNQDNVSNINARTEQVLLSYLFLIILFT